KSVPDEGASQAAVGCIFFFSGRRRHTRFDCDWSSDVCSSDLPSTARRRNSAQNVLRWAEPSAGAAQGVPAAGGLPPSQAARQVPYGLGTTLQAARVPVSPVSALVQKRSEERRVGKSGERWGRR